MAYNALTIKKVQLIVYEQKKKKIVRVQEITFSNRNNNVDIQVRFFFLYIYDHLA